MSSHLNHPNLMDAEQLRNRLLARIQELSGRLSSLNKETHTKQFYNTKVELNNAEARLRKLEERIGPSERSPR